MIDPKKLAWIAICGGVAAIFTGANVARLDSRGSGNAQRKYERYLALAQAQAQSGDVIGAENYYQHAEHYFRSMSSDPETT